MFLISQDESGFSQDTKDLQRCSDRWQFRGGGPYNATNGEWNDEVRVFDAYKTAFLMFIIIIRLCDRRYLTLKASLLVPEMLQHLAKFHAMTAFWLIQVNVDNVTVDEGDKQSFAPKQYRSVTFPLSEVVPITLRYKYVKYTRVSIGTNNSRESKL